MTRTRAACPRAAAMRSRLVGEVRAADFKGVQSTLDLRCPRQCIAAHDVKLRSNNLQRRARRSTIVARHEIVVLPERAVLRRRWVRRRCAARVRAVDGHRGD